MKNLLLSFAGLLIISLTFPTEICGQGEEESSGFGVNANISSNYIWRGTRYGNGPHIQPDMKYNSGRFTAGVWGSFSFSGYSEADPYISYTFPLGLSVGVTDYYYPDLKLSDFSVANGSHALELNCGYTWRILNLNANYILNKAGGAGSAGDDLYFQTGFTFSKFNVFAGAGNGWHTSTGKFNVCNIGVGTGKVIKLTDAFTIPVTGQVIINPEREQLFIVAGFSF
ncbi:MAG TPA: TorF family putative porin [Bacteroidales bacterium]|nr:TorF family putative porin [Bacteroidales bacterium]